MTVFKCFFKILKNYFWLVILYSVILIGMSSFSLQTNQDIMDFDLEKPSIAIVNQGQETEAVTHLKEYLSKYTTMKEFNENELDDALFYRDIHYIITLKENYTEEFFKGNQAIEVKQNGNFNGYYVEMLLKDYLKVAKMYQQAGFEDQEVLNKMNQVFENQITVTVDNQTDTNALSKATFYYNFMNYSILAVCIFIIGMLLSSFQKQEIRKRNIVSSMKTNSLNRILYLANTLFCLVLWIFYVLVSFLVVGDVMFSLHGLGYILNSLAFLICAVSIGFLLGSVIQNQEAINGVVNVIALGSSFLCGSFVPMEWLPQGILTIAHILPSYWYIQNNEWLKGVEVIDWNTITPWLQNIGIILLFAIFFFVLTNIITRKKRKLA